MKPIGNKLVLKKQEREEEETFSGIVLPSSAKEAPVYAEVLVIGSEVEEDERMRGSIKVGDKVIYSKYVGTEIKLEDTDYILVKCEDILTVVKQENKFYGKIN